MQLDKNQQKQLINEICISSEKRGYKMKTNTIYKVIDNALIHCDVLIIHLQKMVYRIYIKIMIMMISFGTLCK